MKIKLFFLFSCLYGFASAQTADLLDVRFQLSGKAQNVSKLGLPITTPLNTPVTFYDSSIKQFVSNYSGNSTYFYKVNYVESELFKTAIAGDFTIEAYIKATSNTNMCAVSAQEVGGFGIEQSGSNSLLQFWYNTTRSAKMKTGSQRIYYSLNPSYDHVVFTVSPSRKIVKAYYNGVEKGKSTIAGVYRPPSNSLAHWLAMGGDASILSDAQYAWNGNIAFTRMYSTALTTAQVKVLYGQVQARLALTKVEDLRVMITNKLVAYLGSASDSLKKATAERLLNEGWDLMGTMNTTDIDIQRYLKKIEIALSDLIPSESKYPNFAVISDPHVGNTNRWSVKINRTIDQLLSQKTKLDAVFVTGDITDGGEPAELADAKNIFSRLAAVVPVYYMMGNHDWYYKDTPNNSDNSGVDFSKTFDQPANQYLEIKGYPFITISMESSNQVNAYATVSKNFLTAKLIQASTDYPGKPIFLFVHVPASGTVYGAYNIGGEDNWGTSGLKEICEQYPQLVVFSGHSHYPIGDERSIHQDKFTSINVGSLTYAEMETGLSTSYHPPGNNQITEGCFVSITDGNDINIKRWDFTRKEEIKSGWLIKAPFTKTNFAYAARTGGIAPYFLKSDKAIVTSITDNGCKVIFPQGQDDDLVHHYLVEVLDENNVVLTTARYTIFSGFYLNSETPKTLSWDVLGLAPSTKYTISVTAVDSYENVSPQPIVSKQFKTKAYKVNAKAKLVMSDLLAVNFKANGSAVDVSPRNFSITAGSQLPNTIYDKSIKQYINRANGNSKQYFKVDYQSDSVFKNTLQNGFSLETYLKTSSKDVMSPVSSQESGGFGIEQAREGNLEFWFRKSMSTYETLSVGQLDTGRYYHVVFSWDNTSKKLAGYVNGILINEKTLRNRDELVFSATQAAQWIGIGGDANSENVQSPFIGDISTTRLYSKALSRDEVVLAYQQIKNRSGLSNVDDLNVALTVSIPDQIRTDASRANTLNKLLAKGWALMGNLSTTEAEIVAFLNQLKRE